MNNQTDGVGTICDNLVNKSSQRVWSLAGVNRPRVVQVVGPSMEKYAVGIKRVSRTFRLPGDLRDLCPVAYILMAPMKAMTYAAAIPSFIPLKYSLAKR